LRGEWDYALKLFQWLMPSRFLLKWLNIDAKTRIGNAHIECLKRLFTSPSGNAIKNVSEEKKKE